MRVAGCYQVMRHKDHAMPAVIPRSLLGRRQGLDVRIWCWDSLLGLTLLVNASRKHGCAVRRNHFRRQVRMAFLRVLRGGQTGVSITTRCVVWIRPTRDIADISKFSFQEIESQIRLALSRWEE